MSRSPLSPSPHGLAQRRQDRLLRTRAMHLGERRYGRCGTEVLGASCAAERFLHAWSLARGSPADLIAAARTYLHRLQAPVRAWSVLTPFTPTLSARSLCTSLCAAPGDTSRS